MFFGQLFAPRLYLGRLWGLTAAPAQTIINTTSFPAVQSGVLHTLPISVTGTGPFVLSTTAGALPPGVSYVGTSIVVSSSTAPGSYLFTTRATGPTGVYDEQEFLLTVVVQTVPANSPSAAVAGAVFKLELLQAIHNFSASGDTFKLALYGPSASISAATPVYTTQDEAVGAGYTAGGVTLTNIPPTIVENVAVATFSNALFPAVSITVQYALIYNASKNNRAVAVIDFGQPYTLSEADFEVSMPPVTATNALIRMT
jgi:hypothetical protein